jgi:hypothetical protein
MTKLTFGHCPQLRYHAIYNLFCCFSVLSSPSDFNQKLVERSLVQDKTVMKVFDDKKSLLEPVEELSAPVL